MSNITHDDHEFVIDELTEEDYNHNPKIINTQFPLSPFCDMRKSSINLVF